MNSPTAVAPELRRIPRYTSYPTALDLIPGFPGTAASAALDATNHSPVPPELALYLHIPFCRKLCWYCGCNKQVTRHEAPIDRYLDSLRVEAEVRSAAINPARGVALFQMGGGTPNILGTERMRSLLQHLRRLFNWRTDADAGIELDPRLCDAQQLTDLRELGFTRVSFGVQDLDPAVGRAIHREQSAEHILQLVRWARHMGFTSVNADVVYGLPRQTPRSLRDTVARLADAGVQRFALFEYAHLPQQFPSQRLLESCGLPDADAVAGLFEAGRECLQRRDFERLGLDHFALPDDPLVNARHAGTLRRGFQGYFAGAGLDLLGLGASAISEYGTVLVQNAREVSEYNTRIAERGCAVVRGRTKSTEDQVRGFWIEQVMCSGRAQLRKAIDAIPGADPLAGGVWSEARMRWQRAGLHGVRWDGASLELGPEQWHRLRELAFCFDGFRHPAAKQAGVA